jgi:hypothetical protein
MFDVSFEVNGKKVPQKDFGKTFASAIEAEMYKRVQESVKRAVGNAVCTVHGKAPSVVVKGSGLSDLSFEVHGCCHDLIDQVTQKLKTAFR